MLTTTSVGCFIKQLLETSPDILRECLIHLQEHMVTVITASTSGTRNIHVMMEFLLIILIDVPGDLIHHDKLFDLLARIGVLIKKVLTLVHGLEEKSMKKESTNETTLVSDLEEKSMKKESSTDETNCATLDLQENIELLKEDLKHVYLKAPNSSQCCFPMNDGLLFMHLLHIHLNELLDSNAYSVALIKEEIVLMKQDLEFIRSVFSKCTVEVQTLASRFGFRKALLFHGKRERGSKQLRDVILCSSQGRCQCSRFPWVDSEWLH